MNILCSPRGIADAKHPGQGIMDIAQAGFTDILLDFSAVCTEGDLENIGKPEKAAAFGNRLLEEPKELQVIVKPILDNCRKENLRFLAARAPYLMRETKHKDLNGLLARLAEESLRICKEADCRYLIIRPQTVGISYGEEWKINREYYLGFVDLARECGVMILLENQCKNMNGHLIRGICADGEEAASWVDKLNEEAKEERFGFCMDTGVCNICGQNMQEFAHTLGNRLKAVILRDCDGNRENAMLPFTSVDKGESKTDWLSLIRGLREIGFDGRLIMNFADTSAAFSPLLRPDLIRLAKKTGDYFRWQIGIEDQLKKSESIVLFGAGNMCRNYMKCYGEKYPPLFTCDNNRAVWGSNFCGLEVKPPECLKSLPKNCTIFICNIYYREIERQLRKMGVLNPIEFFNDEYMPSFYFDRLERP